MYQKFLIKFFFFFFISFYVFADTNSDQWQDSNKTYLDLVQEGFQVKGYDVSNIKIYNGQIMILFVTVLQKNSMVYECQEYQTLDSNLKTLDIAFVCRELVQPYKKGLDT